MKTFRFGFSAAPLSRIASAVLLLGLFCLVGSVASRAASAPRIAPVLQPFVDDSTLAGAVTLVATAKEVLSVETVGWMDIKGRKPMRADCLFWIASQSKPITGAAIMILVDQGKVSVDDPVSKYLPEFSDMWVKAEEDPAHVTLQRPKRPILVRDLLTHTSGMLFKSLIEQPTLDLYPLEVRVRSYAMMPLKTEPGAKYAYSNAGINTAGRIVEVVSGMPLDRFLNQSLFEPLKMRDTTFWPSPAQLKRLAKAYKPEGDTLAECPINQLQYPLDDHARQPMPAGGLFSTAGDLARFYRMLANGGILDGQRVLSEKAVEQMTSDQSGVANAKYGFGIGATPAGFSHGGAYSTNSRYDRQSGLITIFLVQHASWGKKGATILPAFQKAAVEAYSSPSSTAANKADASPTVGIPGVGSTPNPSAATPR